MPVLIRVERPEDAAAIRRVHGAAFGRELEARIVDDLRAAGDALTALSLVAEDDGEIVGHVAISRARLEERPALALGPIGVLPDRQREGIGSALMHETIERAGAAGEDVVVLLGHADYYPRFGFIRASRLGIVPPFDVPDEAFMALELRTDGAGGGGRFAYPPAFEASVD